MNRIQLTILLFSLTLFGACAASNGRPPPSTSEHHCPGSNPGIVPININYNGAKINVAPDPQTAHQGDVLRFNLIGNDEVLVSIYGKTPEANWLHGSGKRKDGNAASQKFFICVPTDLFDDEENGDDTKSYGYNVNASDSDNTWPELDPIVIIDQF